LVFLPVLLFKRWWCYFGIFDHDTRPVQQVDLTPCYFFYLWVPHGGAFLVIFNMMDWIMTWIIMAFPFFFSFFLFFTQGMRL